MKNMPSPKQDPHIFGQFKNIFLIKLLTPAVYIRTF